MTAGSKPLVMLLCGVAAVVAACAGSRSQEPDHDGLVRQWNTRLNTLFLKPDADISGFHDIVIDPVQIRFARNWNRGAGSPGRRLDATEVASIQTRLAEMFHEIFVAELTSAGYTIVEQPGDETLRISAAIVDLFVTAPDTMPAGRVTTFTADSGRMTLVLELRDSVTGEILARAADTRTGRGSNVWTVTNRVTNTGDARAAIRLWAVGLRQALAEMYAPTR